MSIFDNDVASRLYVECNTLKQQLDASQCEVERLQQVLREIAEAYANNEPISAQWAKEALNPPNAMKP